MTKTYVIDTNVVLTDADAIFKFEDNIVVLPITILEEADKFKKEQNETGRNARQFARNLDSLRKLGRLDEGVKLENGGIIKTAMTLSRSLLRLPYDLDDNVPDNRILSVAIDCGGILVSRDINLRVKADSVGVPAEDYTNSIVTKDDFYTGTGKGYITSENLCRVYTNKKLDLKDVILADADIYPNQCFTLESVDNTSQAALAKYDAVMKEFVLLPQDMKTLGLTPKNAEQQHALNLLLDPNIPLISIIGRAGSGKTLMACAAALHGVMESKLYDKVLLLKPIVSVDSSHQLGYLPGSLSEKLAPWLSSFSDNISYLLGRPNYEEPPKVRKGKKCDWEDKNVANISPMEELIALGLLECGSLEHLRGRSLPKQFLLVDEAQNASSMTLKTIITRAGEGTKVVLIGDISQTDLPYLTADNNGLTLVAEKFKGTDIAAHITLEKTVRSKLAEMAATIL